VQKRKKGEYGDGDGKESETIGGYTGWAYGPVTEAMCKNNIDNIACLHRRFVIRTSL